MYNESFVFHFITKVICFILRLYLHTDLHDNSQAQTESSIFLIAISSLGQLVWNTIRWQLSLLIKWILHTQFDKLSGNFYFRKVVLYSVASFGLPEDKCFWQEWYVTTFYMVDICLFPFPIWIKRKWECICICSGPAETKRKGRYTSPLTTLPYLQNQTGMISILRQIVFRRSYDIYFTSWKLGDE